MRRFYNRKARFDWFIMRLVKDDAVTLIEVDATHKPLTMRQAEAIQRRKYKGDWNADFQCMHAYNWRKVSDERKIVLKLEARRVMA